ncbi:MAG: hypothetical protein SLAVMIC_00511 [uncultured marine phage]|uniref:Uncharacterized protein n=1 Tax=uncultured marine phage TaxID=707152 RepID=A0A8D9FS76_9VIRU|nr:MAG: hypothetical protein SLAVMIC_00511 [uncultured marine phage]
MRRFEWKWKYLWAIPLFLAIVFTTALITANNRSEKDKYSYYYTMGEYDTTKIDVDPRVVPYLEDFIEDAHYYGYDTDFIYGLNSIVIGDLSNVELDGEEKRLHGICISKTVKNRNYGNIILSEKLYKGDKHGFKLVLYHEIGHWMGRDHLPLMSKSDKLLVDLKVQNINKFAGIMHDGYDMSNSAYVREYWGMLRHNFFVRFMPIDEQKCYMQKFLKDEIIRDLEELESEMEECGHSEDLCDKLYELEDIQRNLDTMSVDKYRGMFRL